MTFASTLFIRIICHHTSALQGFFFFFFFLCFFVFFFYFFFLFSFSSFFFFFLLSLYFCFCSQVFPPPFSLANRYLRKCKQHVVLIIGDVHWTVWCCFAVLMLIDILQRNVASTTVDDTYILVGTR